MKELIIIFIIGVIITFLGWLFLYLPVMGFANLYLGEFALGLLFLLPLLCLIGGLCYRHYINEPEKIRMAALSRMYRYPLSLSKKVNSDQWHKGFLKAIHEGLANVDGGSKQADLNICERVVKKMAKENAFNDFQRAFKLTGCHMEIKDSAGNTVTKIV